MRVRISPSLLDQYLKVERGLYNATEKDLIRYLTEPFVPNEAVSRGKAYHELLEHGPERYERENEDGEVEYAIDEPEMGIRWVFSQAAAQPAIDHYRKYNETMLHEVWADYDFQVAHFQVKMRMRLDGVDSTIGHEHKTTKRSPKIETYEPSYQWRANLAAFPELQGVRYNVFQLNTKNTACKKTSFIFWRPPDVESQVQDKALDLLLWIERNDLIEHVAWDGNDRNPFRGI